MQYEWVIRVDNDSAFPKVIPYDIIGVMEERGAKYGFRVMSPDGSEVTQALPEAAKYWLVSEGVTPTFLLESCNPSTMDGLSSDGWSKHIFYNNFFVTNVGFWVRPDVQSWLKLLEYLNGFYKFRWGDAPVHTVTLGMFSPKKELLEFGFEYEHQGNFSADKSYALLSELDFVTEPT